MANAPRDFHIDDYGQATVSVVILARNEVRTIHEAVEEAKRFAHEVIVMDGRSTDGTGEVAEQAGARVFTDSGRGKGAAIRESLDHAQSDVVVFMDADGSHDPADIPRLAFPVLLGKADLCVGSRFTGGSEELSINFGQLIRTIGNIAMNIAINKRWHVELTDTLNGFRAAGRVAIRSVGLTEDRHTIEQEMVMKMLRHGYRVVNVPAHEFPRRYGDSHIRIGLEWPLFVWCVAKNLIWKTAPDGFVATKSQPLIKDALQYESAE